MNYIKHVVDHLQPIFVLVMMTIFTYFLAFTVSGSVFSHKCVKGIVYKNEKNKFRNATRCLCRSVIDAQPQVSMLMTHYQSEEGDYRDLGVFLERKRAACNHWLILRAALELCLITAEL